MFLYLFMLSVLHPFGATAAAPDVSMFAGHWKVLSDINAPVKCSLSEGTVIRVQAYAEPESNEKVSKGDTSLKIEKRWDRVSYASAFDRGYVDSVNAGQKIQRKYLGGITYRVLKAESTFNGALLTRVATEEEMHGIFSNGIFKSVENLRVLGDSPLSRRLIYAYNHAGVVSNLCLFERE